MRVNALTACVDFADYLAHAAKRWAGSLASWTIVTVERDRETIDLAESFGARVHVTDAWYRDGAAFNKGAAMEEARRLMPWTDWILFADADVVPPADWRDIVEAADPKPWRLHGALRHECSDPRNLDPLAWPPASGDGVGVGFFQLFHSSDPAANPAVGPLIQTQWKHAGNYDNELMNRWRPPLRDEDHRVLIPGLHLCHLGERGQWFGRGRTEEMAAMRRERAARGGRWDHEAI